MVKISIRCSNGESFDIELEKKWTILEVKEAIEKKKEIPSKEIRLIFRGRVLKDNESVESYGKCFFFQVNFIFKIFTLFLYR